MRRQGLAGAVRSKPIRTTLPDKAAACPLDHVNRQFHAPRPNMLWLSDSTYVSTWTGFVYMAFVIDAFARRIVGWRVSRTTHASFMLDALEQASDRHPIRQDRRQLSRLRPNRSHTPLDTLICQQDRAMVMGVSLACGCPVIASRHTGAEDLFTDDAEGFIIAIRSSDAIFYAMESKLAVPSRAKHMREQARKRIELIGGLDRYGNTWARELRTVLEWHRLTFRSSKVGSSCANA